MANEVVISSGRMLPMGDKRVAIRDDGVPVQFVDVLTEARHGNGVVCLSFGATITDADNEEIVMVASRLRMNLGTAQFVHKMLGDMITAALKPVDKSQAN